MLCELSVMAVEKNGVFFHHFVARKALTPPEGLDLKSTLEKPVEFAVDAKKMREDLAWMLGQNPFSDNQLDSGFGNPAGSLDEILNDDKPGDGRSKPTYVDANKLVLVAFVQHAENHRVLAAKSFKLPQEDEVP
jgi:hypothetical protein